MLAACEGRVSEVSDLALVIKPELSDTLKIQAGDYVEYKLYYYNNNGGTVNKLTVSSFDNVRGRVNLIDKEYDLPVMNDTYQYHAPQTTGDSVFVTLTFTAFDTKGVKREITRYVIVHNKQVLLPEKGPIILYLSDGKHDAFKFIDPTQTFDHVNSADSLFADLYVDCDSNGKPFLHSRTKTRFVRYNEFNYSETTAVGLQTVYYNSRRDEFVSDLSVNDIVLLGHDDQAEGIIFISNLIQNNTEQDCIQVLYKGIDRY